MKTIATSLHHCAVPPEGNPAGPHPTLVLLHGRGANEEDLLGLAPALDPRFLLIAPRAPFPFGYGGFTWYDIDETGAYDPAMFEASCTKLDQLLLDIVKGYPVDPSRLFLFGFSMGAVMSYVMALEHPGVIKGIVANSGYLPSKGPREYQWNTAGGLHVLITHGTEDPVIPVAYGRKAHDQFAASPASVTYKEYVMGHEITEQSLADATAWLSALL